MRRWLLQVRNLGQNLRIVAATPEYALGIKGSFFQKSPFRRAPSVGCGSHGAEGA
jgi:hypothetical protein